MRTSRIKFSTLIASLLGPPMPGKKRKSDLYGLLHFLAGRRPKAHVRTSVQRDHDRHHMQIKPEESRQRQLDGSESFQACWKSRAPPFSALILPTAKT